MGYLFENMKKISIQKARRRTEAQRKLTEEEHKKLSNDAKAQQMLRRNKYIAELSLNWNYKVHLTAPVTCPESAREASEENVPPHCLPSAPGGFPPL